MVMQPRFNVFLRMWVWYNQNEYFICVRSLSYGNREDKNNCNRR